MTEPWHGAAPPDMPVTVTLSYQAAKRALVAVVREGHRAISRGDDPVGVEQLAAASDALGDALSAPPHRRFNPARRHAVVAVTEEDFTDALGCLRLGRGVQPILVRSVDDARGYCYTGSTITELAAEKLRNCSLIVDVVRARTFPR